MSAAPAALHRYLAAVPAMSLIPFAPFFGVRLGLQDRHDFGPSRTGVSFGVASEREAGNRAKLGHGR